MEYHHEFIFIIKLNIQQCVWFTNVTAFSRLLSQLASMSSNWSKLSCQEDEEDDDEDVSIDEEEVDCKKFKLP